MRKISQGVATKIATDMVAETIGKKIAKAKKDLQEQQNKLALESIHPEVATFDAKFPGYCKKDSTIRCFCGELHLGNLSVDYFPSKESTYYKTIEIARGDYDWILNQFQLIKSLEAEESKLHNQIYETLLQLSTPKRIQSDFPEAYVLLEVIIKEEEDQKCTVIALPIDEIKNSLLRYKD